MAHIILSNLKTFKKAKTKKFLDITCHFFTEVIIYELLYFTSFWFGGVEIHKIKKKNFFSTYLNKFATGNYPLMQLRLAFHKIINKNKLKV